ncbi:hypothetical protein CYY_010570, partial [Polysphondylium violaceum]
CKLDNTIEYKQQLKKLNSRLHDIVTLWDKQNSVAIGLINQFIEEEEEKEEKLGKSSIDGPKHRYEIKEIDGIKRIVKPEINEFLYEAYLQMAYGYIKSYPKLAFQTFRKCQQIDPNAHLWYVEIAEEVKDFVDKQELLDFLDTFTKQVDNIVGPRFNFIKSVLLYDLGRYEDSCAHALRLSHLFTDQNIPPSYKSYVIFHCVQSILAYIEELDKKKPSTYRPELDPLNHLNVQEVLLLRDHLSNPPTDKEELSKGITTLLPRLIKMSQENNPNAPEHPRDDPAYSAFEFKTTLTLFLHTGILLQNNKESQEKEYEYNISSEKKLNLFFKAYNYMIKQIFNDQ